MRGILSYSDMGNVSLDHYNVKASQSIVPENRRCGFGGALYGVSWWWWCVDSGLRTRAIVILLGEAALNYPPLLIFEPLRPGHFAAARHSHFECVKALQAKCKLWCSQFMKVRMAAAVRSRESAMTWSGSKVAGIQVGLPRYCRISQVLGHALL